MPPVQVSRLCPLLLLSTLRLPPLPSTPTFHGPTLPRPGPRAPLAFAPSPKLVPPLAVLPGPHCSSSQPFSSSGHRSHRPVLVPPSRPRARLFCPVTTCPDHSLPLTVGPRSVPCVLTSMLTLQDSSLPTTPSHGLASRARFQYLRGLPTRPEPPFQWPLPFLFQHVHCPVGSLGVWEVFTSDKQVRTSVPEGARDAWSRCLITALADIVAHRPARCQDTQPVRSNRSHFALVAPPPPLVSE